MKMNNRQIMKLLVIALLVIMIGVFTQCVPQNSVQVGHSGDEGTSYNSPVPTPGNEGQIIQQAQVSIGVKNHEQILHTMGEVTGIDPYSSTTIMNVYRQVAMTLPTDNDLKIFSTTQQLSITKLASEFCFSLANNVTLRAQVWPTLMYTSVPSVALTPERRTSFINSIIDNFWGGMLTNEEIETAHVQLGQLIDDLVGTDTNTAATQRTVRGVCTAALSSAYITLL